MRSVLHLLYIYSYFILRFSNKKRKYPKPRHGFFPYMCKWHTKRATALQTANNSVTNKRHTKLEEAHLIIQHHQHFRGSLFSGGILKWTFHWYSLIMEIQIETILNTPFMVTQKDCLSKKNKNKSFVLLPWRVFGIPIFY